MTEELGYYRKRALKASKGVCAKCGIKLNPNRFTIHHITPLETIVLCNDCHHRIHHPFSNPTRIINFYLDEATQMIIDDFKEICRREGESMSTKIREFITRYVMVHRQGNPQLLLEKFIGEIKQGECFFCKAQFPNLRKVEYASGLIAPTCEDCLNRNKAKGSFSTVKKVFGLMK